VIRFGDVLQTIPPSPGAGELLPGVDIIGRGRKGWCSGHRVRARALEALGIAAGEDQLCPLCASSPSRFETDSRAAADHNDGLPEEFELALTGRGGGCCAQGSFDQPSNLPGRLKA
jgi:hypothetical protein